MKVPTARSIRESLVRVEEWEEMISVVVNERALEGDDNGPVD